MATPAPDHPGVVLAGLRLRLPDPVVGGHEVSEAPGPDDDLRARPAVRL
jgi:hypothetical protein